MSTDNLDISNAKKWDNSDWLRFFKDRLDKMRSARGPYEAEWEKNDKAVDARSFYDNYGQLTPIIPLEKVLLEIYPGRTKGHINYDLKCEGQTNINELQPSKFILSYVLDGSYDENFWEENKRMKMLKAQYGNGIFYTGPRERKDYRREMISSDVDDVMAESNYKKIEHSEWHLFPKNIHIRDFYIDDNALGQPSVQYADDCILKEKITRSELELRYEGVKGVDQKELKLVTSMTDESPQNNKSSSIDQDEIIIHTYWNKITKDFMVVANETQLLIKNRYYYDDGKLPFVNIQHYYNPNSFYAEGIPSRVSYLKVSKSDAFLSLLAGARMESGINLIVGNDDQIGQSWEMGGNQVNLWRTSGGAENIKPINTSTNLASFQSIMQFIDQEIAIVTGINPSEQITATSDVLGIVEINEANKAVRTGSVDESYEVGIDNALTMTLARIVQFHTLFDEKKKGSDGEILKRKPKEISVEGIRMVNRNGKDVIEEDEGVFGKITIEAKNLRPGTVKITTNSTSAVLPIIERKKVNDYIDSRLKISQIAGLDQTGEAMKKLVEESDLTELIEWTNDAYGIDQNDLKYNTKADKIRHINEKKMQDLKEALTLRPKNEPTTQNPMSGQVNGQPIQGQGPVEGGEGSPIAPQ